MYVYYLDLLCGLSRKWLQNMFFFVIAIFFLDNNLHVLHKKILSERYTHNSVS